MWKLSEMVATPATQGYIPISEFSEVSPETRRARGRSGFGRVNTNANRKNGGGSTWSGVKVEALAGAQIVTPSTSTIKTRDDSGTPLPMQHMARVTSEDEHLRARARADAERRELTEYH